MFYPDIKFQKQLSAKLLYLILLFFQSFSLDEKPDLIIVDPPRDGIHPKALEKILAFGVDEIVYISCKPTSLARDLETIIRRGYRVDKVCCVDQFPRTSHVESVVSMSRKTE